MSDIEKHEYALVVFLQKMRIMAAERAKSGSAV
jgi:hypothetical protein